LLLVFIIAFTALSLQGFMGFVNCGFDRLTGGFLGTRVPKYHRRIERHSNEKTETYPIELKGDS
jgi:hypothetical protein